MPGGPTFHGRLEKLSVSLPPPLLREIEGVVKSSGYWLSPVDFIREAAVEKLERWKAEHKPASDS